jgi:hypothetical protein
LTFAQKSQSSKEGEEEEKRGGDLWSRSNSVKNASETAQTQPKLLEEEGRSSAGAVFNVEQFHIVNHTEERFLGVSNVLSEREREGERARLLFV